MAWTGVRGALGPHREERSAFARFSERVNARLERRTAG